MRRRGWRSSVVTVTVLLVQVGLSAAGTIGICVDRPHTHGGLPAPDCRMHHQSAGTPDATGHPHHYQHDGETASTSARLECSCSPDPLTLLATEIAVVPSGIPVPQPNQRVAPSPGPTQSAPDLRLAPLSPPPRPSFC